MRRKLIVLVLIAASCDRPRPQASKHSAELSRLDDPVLLSTLEIVEDASCSDRAQIERRVEAAKRLRALVAQGGAELVREAIQRMAEETAEERKRAMLLLSLASELGPGSLQPLLRSPDPMVRLYPILRGGQMATVGTLADPAFLLPAEEADPLREVATDILTRLLPAKEPAVPDAQQEYCEDWRREIRPRLERFWEQIPKEDRLWLDLDRDGTPECIAIARDVAKTSWYHDFRFIAVLRRDSKRRWAVAGFSRLGENEHVDEVVTGDFNGDAMPEVAVRATTIGGWTWTRLIIVGASAPEGATSPTLCGSTGGEFRVLLPSAGESTPLFLGIQDHAPNSSGKAVASCGVIAREVQVFRWSGSKLEGVGEVYLPRP